MRTRPPPISTAFERRTDGNFDLAPAFVFLRGVLEKLFCEYFVISHIPLFVEKKILAPECHLISPLIQHDAVPPARLACALRRVRDGGSGWGQLKRFSEGQLKQAASTDASVLCNGSGSVKIKGNSPPLK